MKYLLVSNRQDMIRKKLEELDPNYESPKANWNYLIVLKSLLFIAETGLFAIYVDFKFSLFIIEILLTEFQLESIMLLQFSAFPFMSIDMALAIDFIIQAALEVRHRIDVLSTD